MTSRQLNQLLVTNVPNVRQQYIEEVCWQEGDDTGSHVVFGDVLTPYLVICIAQNNQKEIAAIFDFLEVILLMNDDYASEVITFSVFESITYLLKNRPDLTALLGKQCKKALDDVMQ